MSDKKSKEKPADKHSPFAVLKEMKAKLEKSEEAAKEAKKAPAGKTNPNWTPPANAPSAKRSGYDPQPPRRPSTASQNERAAQHEDDALSFHRLMSGVTPLDRKSARIPKSQHHL